MTRYLLLLLASCCLSVTGSLAATVSGTVTNTAYSMAVAGQKVYLVDSGTTGGLIVRDSAITNSSGFYTITVSSSISSGAFAIRAAVCGGLRYSATRSYTGSNLTINLSFFCLGATVVDTVRNSTTGLPVYGQKVYLLDSTATTYRLDSAITNKQGVVTFSVPPSVPIGTLRVFTYACGLQSQSFSYSGSAMTAPTLLICLSNAVISGTVTNTSTSTPVASHRVTVTDSSGTSVLFTDTVLTNSAGVYSVTVPVTVAATGTMIAATQACGSRYTSRATYTGSSLTLNLAVCATSSATVSGTVTDYATGAPISGRKVYLFDSSGTGGIISRDSTTTSATGSYSFSVPASVNRAGYMIGAASCGAVIAWQYRTYSGFSLVVNHRVCGTLGLATLSGTLKDASGAPAAGATVTLNFTLTTTASATGTFSFTIPASWQVGTGLALQASSGCGRLYRSLTHTGANITIVDSLMNTACYTISGIVSKQGGGAASSAKVLLIGQSFDTTVTPVITRLYVIDSTVTNATGHYSFTKNYILSLPHHVKAALQPSDPAYWNFLPTYHDSSLVWSGADTITASHWIGNRSNVHISLRGGTNPGGPAFIGGNVAVGANKSTAVGDPLASRIVLLTTASDQAVAYTFSDAAGTFSFPNLPYGTYKLFGDAGGKTNPPLTITLSPANPRVGNVLFEENDRTFAGSYTTGIGSSSLLQSLSVYPNPATDAVRVSGLAAISGSKTLQLTGLTGALIATQEVASGDIATIPVRELPAGLYLLRITTEEGTACYRIVK